MSIVAGQNAAPCWQRDGYEDNVGAVHYAVDSAAYALCHIPQYEGWEEREITEVNCVNCLGIQYALAHINKTHHKEQGTKHNG